MVGVCREQRVGKLKAFKGRITVVQGATNDAEVIKRAVSGCDGVLVVMREAIWPWENEIFSGAVDAGSA